MSSMQKVPKIVSEQQAPVGEVVVVVPAVVVVVVADVHCVTTISPGL
jgi:hypothetical protein